ncbi:hypothetical protein QQF64_015555 [Cirrhinus molitorella]|uniref:ribonuclease H n=1 Tax=Cirrhinus molitorella TaxID=172907 RepID=A0ABR3NVL8_9TELE
MSVSSTTRFPPAQTNPSFVPVANREKPSKHKDDFFCYQCGKDGHIATKCLAPENTSQVIQKLVHALKNAKTERNRMTGTSSTSSSADCFSKRSQTEVGGASQLPRGLVGPASTISVELNGCPCQALLDSGSQVTIVFDHWVQKLVPIFALVCPEPKGLQQCPVIIGTNVSFFKRLTLPGQDSGVSNQANAMRIQLSSFNTGLKEEVPEPAEGRVKWRGPGALTIPSRSERNQLPSGLFIPPTVLSSSAIDVKHFRVLVCNETSKNISIPLDTVIPNVFPTDTVTNTSDAPVYPKKLDPKFGDFPIPADCEKRLREKLAECGNVFSLDEWDVGQAKDLLAVGIITEYRSPYASPIVIARKKNGAIRMCIDYRTLNSRTIPDQYTTSRMDDALDCLSGSKWFSVLDLRSGYYQIEMAEEDKEKTAFICPLGFYQFDRMPQGITGAPATFQRLMERAVGDMHLLQVIVYLDDLIVFGRTLEEHEEWLLKVLDRLEDYGLKVYIDKCQFCQPQVKYVTLDHETSRKSHRHVSKYGTCHVLFLFPCFYGMQVL